MESTFLRRLQESDLAAADELRRLARWNQTVEDWRRLLSLEPEGCLVALQDGAVVGTVTTTTYGTALAWIGMMLVHPDRRRAGVGTQLIQHALEYLRGRGVKCIKLDATPDGRPLYEKLGFKPEWTLTRCLRADADTVAATAGREDVRPLREEDWSAVEEIDVAAIGAARPALLRSLVTDCLEALVWPAQGAVAGWGVLRRGAHAAYLGPLAGTTNAALEPLALALLQTAQGRPVIWDVPDSNLDARAAAQRFNFAPVRPLTRMYLGTGCATIVPSCCFAIAGPAIG